MQSYVNLLSPLSKTATILLTALAGLLFSPMFILRAIGPLDFWWWMSANLGILLILSWLLDPSYRVFLIHDLSQDIPRKMALGLVSAAILYTLFFVGNRLSRLWFDFAGEGIEAVYSFKGDAQGIRIALLMLLVIGPGEEMFWRGSLQRHFQESIGKWRGFLLTSAVYTGIHVLTGNLMLVLAALVAGLFWGFMYLRYRSMVMNVISHTVWDMAVFLLMPFGG